MKNTEDSNLLNILKELYPFEVVKGDANARSTPNTKQHVNFHTTWVVSKDSRDVRELAKKIAIINSLLSEV